MTYANNVELETSYTYQKHANACKKALKLSLLKQGYTYHPIKKRWTQGKEKVDPDTMMVGIIMWSRANSPFKEHGLFAKELYEELTKDLDLLPAPT